MFDCCFRRLCWAFRGTNFSCWSVGLKSVKVQLSTDRKRSYDWLAANKLIVGSYSLPSASPSYPASKKSLIPRPLQNLAPVVRRLDNAIYRIYYYPVDNSLRSCRDFWRECFVLVAKPRTRVAKPCEDWWKVEFVAREFPRERARGTMAAPLARLQIPPATQANG